jgi:hypothetical protein
MVMKKRAFLNEAISSKGSISPTLRGLEDLRMPSPHQKIGVKTNMVSATLTRV